MVNVVSNIKRTNGIAGQYQITADVTHPGDEDGPETTKATFVGNTSGGPIVLVLPSGAQTFVSHKVTERIGSVLTPTWVRRFFGEDI